MNCGSLACTSACYCETNIDECASSPCINGGSCFDEDAGYTCNCPSQFFGDTCSHHVCDGDQSPCVNGGTCYVLRDKARCKCPAAFSGAVCEREKCLDTRCLNGATCQKGMCVCRPGFVGASCAVDVCQFRKCMHGGSCNAGECQCVPGFTGQHCQTEVGECTGVYKCSYLNRWSLLIINARAHTRTRAQTSTNQKRLSSHVYAGVANSVKRMVPNITMEDPSACTIVFVYIGLWQ